MGNPMTELQGVTGDMGSDNVTCHPTQANTPRLKPQPVKIGTRFTYHGGMEG